jgi:asparagine synthase (glutamine-hydrolysing)
MISIDLDKGIYEKSIYYDFDYTENHELGFEEARRTVKELLVDSVRRNLVSDAPLGMTLSGGIDTSSMLGIVNHLGLSNQMNTFSLKMGQSSFDESPYQQMMAKRCNTIHHEILVTPDDVIENMVEQISYMDEPNGNGACIPSYILAKEASKHVKVLLSGEGGDEVFNAYPTISAYQYRKYYRMAPSFIRSGIRGAIHMLPADYNKLSFDFKAKRFTSGAELSVPDAHLYWRHVFDEKGKDQLFSGHHPYKETTSFYRDLFQKMDGNDINRISYIDMKHFFLDDLMVKNDRTFLANSVEGRFPLMDRFLVDYATKLPVSFKVRGLHGLRYIQKEAMKEFLPAAIYKRQGFGLEMPHSIWFLDKLGGFAEKYLNKIFVEKTEFLNWEYIERIWNIHKSGKADYGRAIWCVLNYLIWFDLFVYNGNYKDYWRS